MQNSGKNFLHKLRSGVLGAVINTDISKVMLATTGVALAMTGCRGTNTPETQAPSVPSTLALSAGADPIFSEGKMFTIPATDPQGLPLTYTLLENTLGNLKDYFEVTQIGNQVKVTPKPGTYVNGDLGTFSVQVSNGRKASTVRCSLSGTFDNAPLKADPASVSNNSGGDTTATVVVKVIKDISQTNLVALPSFDFSTTDTHFIVTSFGISGIQPFALFEGEYTATENGQHEVTFAQNSSPFTVKSAFEVANVVDAPILTSVELSPATPTAGPVIVRSTSNVNVIPDNTAWVVTLKDGKYELVRTATVNGSGQDKFTNPINGKSSLLSWEVSNIKLAWNGFSAFSALGQELGIQVEGIAKDDGKVFVLFTTDLTKIYTPEEIRDNALATLDVKKDVKFTYDFTGLTPGQYVVHSVGQDAITKPDGTPAPNLGKQDQVKVTTVSVNTANEAPNVIGLPGSTTMFENASVKVLPFTISDDKTSPDSLGVIASSSNTDLFDVSVSGSGTNRTLTVTPKTKKFGNGTANVIVTDGQFTTTVPVTVDINHEAPVAPANTTIPDAIENQSYSTVLPVFTSPAGYVMTYTVSNLPTGYSFDAASRTLSCPSPQRGGTFTYIANDGTIVGTNNPANQKSVSLTINFAGLPSAPSALVATNKTTTSFTLSWVPNGVMPQTFKVYRDGVLVASPATNTANIAGLTPNTTYSMTVSGVTTAGEGPLSAPSSVITLDVDAPETVAAPTFTNTTTTGTTAVNHIADANGVRNVNYFLFSDAAGLNLVTTNATGVFTGLTPNTQYWVKTEAETKNGTTGVWTLRISTLASVTTLSNLPADLGVTFDTTTDSGQSNSDNLTNASIKYNLTTGANTTGIQRNVDNTGWTNLTGVPSSDTITAGSLADGTHTIEYRAMNGSNPQAGAPTTFTITYDSTLADEPFTVTPSIQGATNPDTQLTGEKLWKITSANGGTVGAVNYVGGVNHFSYTAPFAANDTLTLYDVAGNTRTKLVNLTAIPSTPNKPAAVNDTGKSNIDGITKDNQIAVAAVSGATKYEWTYQLNGGVVKTVETATPDYQFPDGDGTYTYTVKAGNTAGYSAASPGATMLLDTVKPSNPSWVGAAPSQQGTSYPNKGITVVEAGSGLDNTPSATTLGTLNGGTIGFVSASGNTITTNYTTPNDVGDTITVRVTDVAGNVSDILQLDTDILAAALTVGNATFNAGGSNFVSGDVTLYVSTGVVTCETVGSPSQPGTIVWTGKTFTYTYTGGVSGTYTVTFSYRGKDGSGNYSSPATITINNIDQ